MIRPATLQDLNGLVAIENRCFETDQLSRRSFRHMLTKGNAVILVDVTSGACRGYTMVLFNTGTSMARLYSFAVHPDYQGRGLAKALLDASEDAAREHDASIMRLEVRKDNTAAINLYARMGYRQFGVHEDYYDDHMDAFRFEKSLVPHLAQGLVRVPFYEQTLDFTCGPAAILMAMHTLDLNVPMNRVTELRIWRESTTIFMTSGHGGCGPYGMALSAYKRGFDVDIYVNEPGAMFVDSVRDPEKKEVMRIVQEDFIEELSHLPVRITHGSLNVAGLQESFDSGGVPIVLISSYRIYREKFPHWVVVTGFDERYIYVHDPFVDYEFGKTPTDCINMPILKKDFERMARYGKAGQKSVLILKARPSHG